MLFSSKDRRTVSKCTLLKIYRVGKNTSPSKHLYLSIFRMSFGGQSIYNIIQYVQSCPHHKMQLNRPNKSFQQQRQTKRSTVTTEEVDLLSLQSITPGHFPILCLCSSETNSERTGKTKQKTTITK